MKTFDFASTLPFSPQTVYDWHASPGAFERLVPPWDPLRVVRQRGEFHERCVVVEGRFGPFPFTWEAQHQDAEPGRGFTDVMVRGPFRQWRHEHRFLPEEAGCRLEDHIEYSDAVTAMDDRWLQARLTRIFQFRHTRTLHDLTRHAAWGRSQRLAITGATGLIGQALTSFLRSGGHQVLCLTRGRRRDRDDVRWDPDQRSVDVSNLEGLDAVVHLAGHNIASRLWSPAEKRRILESRVVGTRFLSEVLASLKQRPGVLVSGSAVGIYGGRDAQPVDETAPAGPGFLADVCRQWEEATKPAEQAGIRTVHLRTAVVLTAMVARMGLPFRLGLGATMGDGRQMMTWVSLDDLVGIIGHAIFTESLSGPVNAGAPEPVSASLFSQTLGAVLHRPAFFHIPALLVTGLLGDLGREVLLQGCAAFPQRLQDTGFTFFYPSLQPALENELP